MTNGTSNEGSRMGAVRRILIILSIMAVGFSIAGYASYRFNADLKQAEYYREMEEDREKGLPIFAGPYCYPDRHPTFLLLIVLFASANLFLLVVVRNSVWAIPTALLSFSVYPYWYMDTQASLAIASSFEAKGLNRYFVNAGFHDLASAVFTSVLTLALLVSAAGFFRRRRLA